MTKTLLAKLDLALTVMDLQFETVDTSHPALAGLLTKTAEQTVDGIRRFYYVSQPPWRILWVSQAGQPLELNGSNIWLSMLVGWDPGTSRFVPQEAEGKQHSKFTVLTIYRMANDEIETIARQTGVTVTTLSQLIMRAPRADQAGGSRGGDVGRPRIGKGAIARTITLSPEQWQKAEQIGNGNASAGLRAAIDGYQESA